MKAFDYLRPTSIEEACELLAAGNGSHRILAGGTDLVVQMKHAKVAPSALVSLRSIPGLSYIRLEDGGQLVMGAATSIGAIENSSEIGRSFPPIATAASWIGSAQVRNRATLGGNLCNAAPSADMAPILIAYGATATIAGSGGERTVPLEQFFVGPGRTALKPGELLIAVNVPAAAAASFAEYRKAFRSAMDIATVGVASWVAFQPGDLPSRSPIDRVRIVLGAVAPTPMRAQGAEQMLVGRTLDEDLIRAASARAAEECCPISDIRGTADYRRSLVDVLSKRALRALLESAGRGDRA